MVPLKMLPFDNKNELQIRAGPASWRRRWNARIRRGCASLSATCGRCRRWWRLRATVGVPSPMDFNGLVRHYYLRRGRHQGRAAHHPGGQEATARSRATRWRCGIRDDLTALAGRTMRNLKIVESPPGPPVMSTIGVAESSAGRTRPATIFASRRPRTVASPHCAAEPGVVDVDTTGGSADSRRACQFIVPTRRRRRSMA